MMMVRREELMGRGDRFESWQSNDASRMEQFYCSPLPHLWLVESSCDTCPYVHETTSLYVCRPVRITVLASVRSDRPGQSKRSANQTLAAQITRPNQLGHSHAHQATPTRIPSTCGHRQKKSIAEGERIS